MNTLHEAKSICQLIRMSQVVKLTSLSKSTVYELLDSKSPRYDASFPQRIHLTAGTVCWRLSEVEAWIESKIEGSRINGV